MLLRIKGLALIAFFLLPLVLGAATLVVGGQAISAIRRTTVDSLTRMDGNLDHIAQTLAVVEGAFIDLNARVAGVVTASEQVSAFAEEVEGMDEVIRVPDIAIPDIDLTLPLIGEVFIPTPDIAGFSIPAPVIGEIKRVVGDFSALFTELTDIIARIATIQEAPGQVNALIAQTQTLQANLQAVEEQWSGMLTALAVALAASLGGVYLVLVFPWLARGWALLRAKG